MRAGRSRNVRPDDRVQLDAKPQRKPERHRQGARGQSQSDHGDRRADWRRVWRQAAPGIIARAQAAVAARKLNRPVRLLYDRATDTLDGGQAASLPGRIPHGLHAGRNARRRAHRLALGCRRYLRLFVRRHGPEPLAGGRLLHGARRSRPTAPSTAPTRPATPPFAHSATSSHMSFARTRWSMWHTN